MKNIMTWITTKKIAFLTCILFIITMLPTWYLAFYARPTGDDYGYSMGTRQAWLSTHSLIEVFKAGLETTKWMCTEWNGNWFTVFLFTLMPEVFVTYSFWIVPLSMTAIVIAGTICLAHEVLVKRLGLKWYESLMVSAIVLIASYQFIPSTYIGIYWYVGAMQYMFPHAIGLFLLVFLSKFERTGRIRYIVYSAVGTVMIGGSSIFTTMLVFMIYVCVEVLCVKQMRKILLLGIPFVTGSVAFYFQITAPGYAARVGSEFGFSGSRIIDTIVQSLIEGILSIGEYLRDKTCIFILFLITAVIMWECLQKTESTFGFQLPGVFVLFMYGFYAAMFAPKLYAAVETSSGPATMEYLTFILCFTAAIIYLEGWIIHKQKQMGGGKTFDESKYHRNVILPVVFMCCLSVVFFRGMLSESVFKRSIDYVVSGQAEDFKEQIASQMEILLDDSVKEAYLCPINDQQGPLIHMPVTENPEAFTNWAVAGFYGKDKVIMQAEEQQ